MFKKIASIVKYELKWFGTFGIGAQLAGMVFVQRSNKENATSTLNKALKKAKDTETYLLAGRRLPLIPVVLSLFVGWMTSISFIGDPVEVKNQNDKSITDIDTCNGRI